MNVRERILDTALRLFRTYGMKSVTMFDISRECGISKKTVYEHFTDKDALINESIDFMLQQRRSQLTHCAEAANVIGELLEGLQYSEQFAQAINPVMFYELRKYHPDAWARVDAFKQKITLPVIRRNLDRGIAEGLFHDNLNLDIIARMRQLQLEAVYSHGRLHGGKRSWYPNGRLRAEYRYEKGELREASASSEGGKALGDADARALAQRDAAADDAFVASLLAFVAANPPRCDASGEKA